MIERDAQLATARRALRESHRRGAVLVVEGVAGIGKSELCSAISSAATADGMRVLTARGGEYEQDVPHGVTRQLFERVVREDAEDPTDDLMSGPAALAARVLHASDASEDISAHGAADHGLFWLTCNLAARGPVVLMVDDAHWADSQSLRFLLYLARRIDGLPAVLVLARRPDEPGAAGQLIDRIVEQPDAERIELSPLSPTGAAELIALRRGRPVGPAVAHACFAATGGIPFYLTHVATGLSEMIGADEAEVIRHVQSQVPEAVRRSILLRLGRLSPTARPFVDALAVLGDAATAQSLQAVSLADTHELLAAQDELELAEIVRGDGPPAFTHPIIRTAVYGELTHARRRALHSRAARVHAELGDSAELIAHHLLHGEPAGDPWAVEVLRQVAADAIRHGSVDSAVELLVRAAEEPPAVTDRATLLGELGAAELLAGRPADAATHLRAAFVAEPTPAEPLTVALALSRALLLTEGAVSAIEVLDEAGASLPDEDRLRAEVERTALAQFVPTYSREVAQSMHAFAQLPGRSTTERAALAMAALARAYDPTAAVTEALPLARRALAGGTLVTELTCEAPEVGNAAYVLHFAEQTDEYARVVDLCFADARARGSAFGYLCASLAGLLQAAQEGALPTAIGHGEAALAMWPDVAQNPHTQRWITGVVRFLTEAMLAAGEATRARDLVHAWSAAGDLQAPEFAMIRYAQALLDQADGRHEQALHAFVAYGCDTAALGWEDRTTAWRLGAARCAAALGHHDQAAELVEQAISIATTWATPGGLGTAQLVSALVDPAGLDDDRLEQAVATLRRSPCRLQLAEALVTSGAARRPGSDRVRARTLLAEGLDLASACGATPLAARARADLKALGARPRRDRSTGRFALTPTEARIASLAAAGNTNRQIAQQLFVTPKTVELHLTNVFRKLQITNRTMLPDALSAEPDDLAGPLFGAGADRID